MTSFHPFAVARVAAFCLAALATASTACAAAGVGRPIAAAAIDDTVARAMKTFAIPGMAVAIVKDGKVSFAKGYGVRALGAPAPVDMDTVFQIGSNTKAFTAAALAILVDEGKLAWDDKVIDHLPQFQLRDPYVTREFTVRDLLTHRSGLGLGAGDLMFYPATDFTRAEIIHGLRYLQPTSSFRARYDYDNLMYMVAGELIPALTGLSWEDFVEQRIFKPLRMTHCAANHARLPAGAAFAEPHTMVDGKLTRIPVEDIGVIGGAGTINCSAHDMALWLQTQLAHGRAPDGATLFSEARGEEMWTVNTVEDVKPVEAGLLHTHFSGYGLGWELTDEFGYKRVSHTGSVPGNLTWVAMIPELDLGVLVFTNQNDGYAMQAVGNQILDAYVGAPRRDLVTLVAAITAERAGAAAVVEAGVAKTLAGAGPAALPLDACAGRYTDAWRGDVTVRSDGGKLVLKFSRTSKLEGVLTPYSGNVFVVRWADRSLDADAFVRFSQAFDGSIDGITMKAVSPTTDFSFDFQDLSLVKAR
jgi:CubicO group peptidase (beta-lactamase class C family)